MNYLMIIIIGILIAFLYFIFDNFYKEYYLDRTREELFKIRDQLFNYASEGKIDFNEKAYGITRLQLNGMIRFIHEINIIRLIIMKITYSLYRKNDKSYIKYVSECKNAIENLSDDQKRIILSATEEMHKRIIWYIFHSSLIMWFIYHGINLLVQIIHQFSRIDQFINYVFKHIKNWSSLDFEANLISKEVKRMAC